GSSVHLNAGSKLRYPSLFEDEIREVELQGEGYFEIKPTDSHKQFHVKTSQQRIIVLGTSFNIHAYPEEENSYTTLFEGRVRVTLSSSAQTEDAAVAFNLEPGEQAVSSQKSNDSQMIKRAVNLDEVASWLDGRFTFDNKTFDQIMHEFGRWYG